MSTYEEAANEAERIAFLRLEKWLIGIAGKVGLSADEQYIGTALIMDLRRALGLPLLGSCANAPPKNEAEIEARRFGDLHVVEDPEAVEDRELSTAEELCAGSYLGRGNNLP